jgi:hypothetical protein
MSSAENFLQETCAGYNTLASCQNDYHPQEPQGTEGLGVQEGAAEQLATHPVCPSNRSSDHQGVARKPQDQAPQWDRLQHVHLLQRENQDIPCACCHSLTSHQP